LAAWLTSLKNKDDFTEKAQGSIFIVMAGHEVLPLRGKFIGSSTWQAGFGAYFGLILSDVEELLSLCKPW
jgi:hypothetical protein